MNYSIIIVLSLLLAASSCVKEEGKVSSGNSATDTGGETTGSPEVPGAPDPLATYAWHLDNTGQYSFSTGAGTSGEDISLAEAIDAGFTGTGVRIAISDTGTDIDHEDLTGTQLVGEHRNYGMSNSNLWRTSLPDFVGDDAHGTAVAGLIAAEALNGIGSRGVAPDAKYAAFRYIGDYMANYSAASLLARDVDQADGDFDIFNYSYGYGQCAYSDMDPLSVEAFELGITDLRSGKGAIYVQSAGNSYIDADDNCAGNTNVADDLTLPGKIIVGAINAAGTKSSYSTPGSGIWVSAPGGEYGTSSPAMVTADISGCSHGYSQLTYVLNAFNGGRNSLNANCSYTSLMNGTSSAAPVLTGVIALMLQAEPDLTWRDVKHILALTSDEVDYSILPITHPLTLDAVTYVYDYKWIENAAGIDFSNWYGFGRVNALNAVLMANTYTFPLGPYEKTSDPQTDEWYYDSGAISVAIPEGDNNGTYGMPGSTLAVNHNFFVESVEVEISITHSEPSDIGIILTSPSGTESRLLHFNSMVTSTSFPAGKKLLTNAFYGEESLGNWKLTVLDGTAQGDLGTIDNWKVRVNGHRITGDGSNPDEPTAIVIAGSFPSSSETPTIAFTYATAIDVERYEVSVGTAPELTDVADWTSIALNNTNAQLSGLTLTDGTTYYLNIRAVDNMENTSGIVSAPWAADY